MVALRLRNMARPAVWVTGLLLVALAGCEEADPPPAEIWSCTCHFDLMQARPPAMGVEASDWVCGPAGWGGTTARLEAAHIADPPPPLPRRERPDAAFVARVKRLSSAAQSIALEHELAAEVLVTRRVLEEIAAGRKALDTLRGWRRALLAARLDAVD